MLAANPSKTVTTLFRIQMNYLNGAFLAFVFPETDSRQFTFEAFNYWMQHSLMCIIPVYLMRLGGKLQEVTYMLNKFLSKCLHSTGAYTMEPIMDFDWNLLSYASLLLYHFIFLQLLSLVS